MTREVHRFESYSGHLREGGPKAGHVLLRDEVLVQTQPFPFIPGVVAQLVEQPSNMYGALEVRFLPTPFAPVAQKELPDRALGRSET